MKILGTERGDMVACVLWYLSSRTGTGGGVVVERCDVGA